MTVRVPRRYPELVSILVDPDAGVLLRPHTDADVPGIVEQSRDPESIRWTTVPTPAGGYDLADARSFLHTTRQGWVSGGPYSWAIELAAGADGDRLPFAGTIDLRPVEQGVAEVGFGLHPAARGRGAMTSALRLVRDHGLDVLGLRALRWRAVVGNWASRRTAAAAGFRFDGTVRALLCHRGELLDGWVATITADDPRRDLRRPAPPVLTGSRVRLRPFTDGDLGSIVEACSDPDTQHWLVSLPRPYGFDDATAYLESVRELAASGAGWTWCVADQADRCRAAVRMITRYADQHDLADSVVIRCAAGNVGSRRVAEAAGYQACGTQPSCEPLRDGTLADLVSYAHSRSAPGGASRAPGGAAC